MQRAVDSAIGLPRRSTSASRMLLFLMPAEVRRSFVLPPRVITAGEPFGPRADTYALETRRPPKTHRLPPILPWAFGGSFCDEFLVPGERRERAARRDDASRGDLPSEA